MITVSDHCGGPDPIAATLALAEAATIHWDAIVIGAGPSTRATREPVSTAVPTTARVKPAAVRSRSDTTIPIRAALASEVNT